MPQQSKRYLISFLASILLIVHFQFKADADASASEWVLVLNEMLTAPGIAVKADLGQEELGHNKLSKPMNAQQAWKAKNKAEKTTVSC